MQTREAKESPFRVRAVPPGLRIENFRPLGMRGLGDGANSYPHAMGWFKGRLFIGTTRNMLTLHARPGKVPPPPKYVCFPVKGRNPMPPEEMRGEIWRYDPASERWDVLYRSPMITHQGRRVMRDLGYRSMTVFRAPNDSEPALYATTISASGMLLLRTVDGEHFEELGEVGIVDPRMVSCRSLLAWQGRLYFTPTGTRGTQGNETAVPGIFESEDPARAGWRLVSPPNFAAEGNRAVAEVASFCGHLYAATLNPLEGFQLWKTRAEGKPPYSWKRVMSAGAYRGYLNEAALSMRAFGDALYLGTCIAGGGYNRYHKIGPAAGEVIRVFPDDTWDLVVGFPRVTPDGAKLPLSGLGPGFNFPLNGYIWQICDHDGWLYVGTYNAASWFPYLPIQIPEEYLKALDLKDNCELAERFAGCHLWRSHDGAQFTPVTTDGFGTQYNYGVRQLRSTPLGLIVGTANPFGPEVAIRRDGRWSYEPNPRGGLEIWAGSRSPDGEQGEVARVRSTAVSRQQDAMTLVAQLVYRMIYAQVTEEFYEGSGFTQMGHWAPGTVSAREACRNLVKQLLARLPDTGGRLLEVGCGKGATTETLLPSFSEEQITAIESAQMELDAARRRLPGASFRQMMPPKLGFDAGSFESVICVERACFFKTRRSFLNEVHRVLSPGGRLVMSDILYSRTGEALSVHRHRQNYLPDVDAYERLLERAGFTEIEIVDATKPCAEAYRTNLTRYLRQRLRDHEISQGSFDTLFALTSVHVLFLRRYLLVSARKS